MRSLVGSAHSSDTWISESKYADVWEQRGHSTLSIRPRTSSIVVPPLGDRQGGGLLGVLKPVTGLILDSAPSRLTPDIAARGFVSAALAEPAAGIEEARPRLVGAVRSVLRPVLESRYVARRIREVWQAWQMVAPRAKQLYLFSDSDVLIPTSEVHRFMALQEARGVEVSARVFVDSPHVAHLRQYPAEYMAELDQFMAQAAPAA
ncbi:hypothetical protein WJX81_002229 [Elliptochloris bilobata]|uniref:Uncharacterized protein n=1 Tax=Elliptochloris bilobata TaxID=381761 RepID=A0AAW1RRG4_9CHLO